LKVLLLKLLLLKLLLQPLLKLPRHLLQLSNSVRNYG
jgi:hypothetical protein